MIIFWTEFAIKPCLKLNSTRKKNSKIRKMEIQSALIESDV